MFKIIVFALGTLVSNLNRHPAPTMCHRRTRTGSNRRRNNSRQQCRSKATATVWVTSLTVAWATHRCSCSNITLLERCRKPTQLIASFLLVSLVNTFGLIV